MRLLEDVTPWTYEDRETCQEIFCRVFLGPQACSKDAQLVDRLGISDVVLVRSASGIETTMLRPRLEGLRYHVVEMEDNATVSSQKSFSYFTSLLTEIFQACADARVLVVGASGMNRSAALIAAALIGLHGMNADTAQEYLVGRRRCVSLSAALRRQLKEFEVAATLASGTLDQPARTKRARD